MLVPALHEDRVATIPGVPSLLIKNAQAHLAFITRICLVVVGVALAGKELRKRLLLRRGHQQPGEHRLILRRIIRHYDPASSFSHVEHLL